MREGAAVYVKNLAGDKRGVIAGKVENRAGNVGGAVKRGLGRDWAIAIVRR